MEREMLDRIVLVKSRIERLLVVDAQVSILTLLTARRMKQRSETHFERQAVIAHRFRSTLASAVSLLPFDLTRLGLPVFVDFLFSCCRYLPQLLASSFLEFDGTGRGDRQQRLLIGHNLSRQRR